MMKQCQEVSPTFARAEFYTSKVCPCPCVGQPPWELRPHVDTARATQKAYTDALRQHLPRWFIKLWPDSFSWGTERLEVLRKQHNSKHATPLKLLSYYGAIDVPDWIPPRCASYYCGITKSFYMDPGNHVYANVFRLLWPDEAAGHNDEYLGDVIESMLAWRWWDRVMSDRGLGEFAIDILELMQRLVLFTWCVSSYSHNRNY